MTHTENYASFKLRLLAKLIDIATSLIPFCFLLYIVAGATSLAQLAYLILVLLMIMLIPWLSFLYPSVFTYYFYGTIGKLITGLKVVNEQGARLSFKRNLFRHTIGYSFASLFFGLGFWSIIKDPLKQGWHDKAIGSKVLKVNNLWPVAIVLLLVFSTIDIYFVQTAIQKFANGSLPVEINNLIQTFKQDSTGLSAPTATTPTPPSSSDIPPLYPDIAWEATTS
ncbi:RDD family protein, partial [Patescibacteria group bacterium]|nr:RDD family protein [Patescibacteria group bacterium]